MSDYNDRVVRRDSAAGEIDQGLRSYMLRVYNYMTGGVALTGIVAYLVSQSPALMSAIFGTPLQWVVFLGASVTVIVAPRQDMVLVMSRGLGQGPMAGIVTGAGVSFGLTIHAVLAALGIGAVLTTSAMAYEILKYVGAAYLLYLGLRLILSGERILEPEKQGDRSTLRMFLEAAFSNL